MLTKVCRKNAFQKENKLLSQDYVAGTPNQKPANKSTLVWSCFETPIYSTTARNAGLTTDKTAHPDKVTKTAKSAFMQKMYGEQNADRSLEHQSWNITWLPNYNCVSWSS